MSDCLFCKIASGELPSEKLYEDEYILAFRDIYPQTPVHIIIIPKEHIVSAADINAENSHLIAKCFEIIPQIAKDESAEVSAFLYPTVQNDRFIYISRIQRSAHMCSAVYFLHTCLSYSLSCLFVVPLHRLNFTNDIVNQN